MSFVKQENAPKPTEAYASSFGGSSRSAPPVFLSVITIGELRRGIELLRHRGDSRQAERLEEW